MNIFASVLIRDFFFFLIPSSGLGFRVIPVSWNELGSVFAYFVFWKFVKNWLFFFLTFLVEFTREAIWAWSFRWKKCFFCRICSDMSSFRPDVGNLHFFFSFISLDRDLLIDHFKEPIFAVIDYTLLFIFYFSDFGLISYCLLI